MFARGVAVIVFVLACLSQPLALDACALSCEAARATRGPAVAPPCHHTASCAIQIVQPLTPGSIAAPVAVIPNQVVVVLNPQAEGLRLNLSRSAPQHFNSPPIPLRV